MNRVALLTVLLIANVNGVGQPINRRVASQLVNQLKGAQLNENKVAKLVELGKYHLYKPGEAQNDLDSASLYLSQARQLSNALHLVNWQHNSESLFIIVEFEKRNDQVARARYIRLMNDCHQTGDKETEATAKFRLGVWLRTDDHNFPEVKQLFNQAAALFSELKKPEQELEVLQEIAVTHMNEGDLALAQEEFLNVLNRYKAIHYPKLHYTYDLLSCVTRLKGDLNKGLYYGMLCLESMNQTKDTLRAAAFYGDLARVYLEAGEYKQGIELQKKALRAWRQERVPNFSMFSAAGFIARDLVSQHKPQEALRMLLNLAKEIPTNTVIQKACLAQNLAYCYNAVHNYTLAEKYYLETLAWYTRSNMSFEESQQAEEAIGKFYLERNNVQKAGEHLRKALSFFPQRNALSSLKDIHLLLFKVDSTQGNLSSAIHHYQQYKALNDSIFNETKSNQIARLQIQYDTRAKEQNIILLTKQSEVQKEALKRGETTRNAIIAGTILLTGLLGVSYNRYRLKQRSNQLLEAKQLEINQKNQSLEQVLGEKESLLVEKEWMLKEIHHRVKNNLQVITSLLNAQFDFLHDSTALAAIRESQNRVHAMALIHQKLYQSDNLALVDMQQYVHEIVDYLIDSFSRQRSVQEKLTVSAIQLDVTLATPLGLIINEAVTNSLKYAFPQNRSGTITISLLLLENQMYLLTISDDGAGWPPGFDAEQNNTLGLSMIRGLSRQIGGQLHISQNEGVHIRLEFSQTKKTERSRQEVI